MIKLNKTVYRRLLSQAHEAKELELDSLADGVLGALGPVCRDDNESLNISQAELKKEIHKSLWKMALDVVAYHDLKMVDAQKVDTVILALAENFLKSLENSLDVENEIGPMEPKLPGESE